MAEGKLGKESVVGDEAERLCQSDGTLRDIGALENPEK